MAEITLENHLTWHEERDLGEAVKYEQLKSRVSKIEQNLTGSIDIIQKINDKFEHNREGLVTVIQDTREKIIQDTLQLISIIIGLFALILAVFVLLIRDDLQLKDYANLLTFIVYFFIGITFVWLVLWIKINWKRIKD